MWHSMRLELTREGLLTITPPDVGGARGVIVIVGGMGQGDTSSNPGRDRLHFHIALIH